MENSIEEDIAKVNTYIELVLEKDYCNCNELNTILGKHCDGSKNVAYAMQHILSDYKRVLKENEILKEEKEQAWEEWNNLEQGSYQTEQNLKKQLEKLRIENDKLRVIRHETKYGMETTYLIPKERLIEINTNKYIVEIENGKFVDLKEVYQENEEKTTILLAGAEKVKQLEKENEELEEKVEKQEDIIKNALYIINKNEKEKIDRTWLYNFDKCAILKEGNK